MKTLVHLSTSEDGVRMAALVEAFHREMGIEMPEDDRRAATMPLLDGSPHGAAYLIGPRRAPVGYMAMSFGWSIAGGGVESVLTDLYIRAAIRRRGMATEAVASLQKALRGSDIKALHIDAPEGAPVRGLADKLGFRAGPGHRMTWRSGS